MKSQTKNQYSAYSATQRNDETVRETEAHALLNCASKLEAACRPGCSTEDFVSAVERNQELWTVFQSALCDKSNELPRELKTILLNLSVYVDKTSFSALAENNSAYLKTLIDINRNLAAGLSVKPKADGASDTMPPMPSTSGPVRTTA